MWWFQVDGMSCGHCEKAVRAAIQALQADADVQIDLATGKVRVDAALLTVPQVMSAIEEAGYDVKLQEETT